MTIQSRSVLSIAMIVLISVFVVGCGRSSRLSAPDETSASNSRAGFDDFAPAAGMTAVGPADEDVTDAASAREISEPTTISEPGSYRLTRDLVVGSGDGIVITASHVRLWMGEHRLEGPGHKQGRAIVIDGAENVRVRGGRIERFGIGAVLMNARRCQLRGLSIQGGDETADPGAGNPPQIGVLLVNSAMNRVVGNEMHGVNLGLFVRGAGSYANDLLRNEVVGGVNGLLGICYNPASGMGSAGPHDDRVSSNLLARFGTGIQTSAGSAENRFTLNTIRYFTAAYQDLNGTNVFERNRTQQVAP